MITFSCVVNSLDQYSECSTELIEGTRMTKATDDEGKYPLYVTLRKELHNVTRIAFHRSSTVKCKQSATHGD